METINVQSRYNVRMQLYFGDQAQLRSIVMLTADENGFQERQAAFFVRQIETGFSYVTKSRYNRINLAVGIQLVINLLTFDKIKSINHIRSKHICVVISYQAQYRHYITALDKRHEDNRFVGYDRILMNKINVCQREKFEIVIKGLVLIDKSGR